jgi:hypothetical protein
VARRVESVRKGDFRVEAPFGPFEASVAGDGAMATPVSALLGIRYSHQVHQAT